MNTPGHSWYIGDIVALEDRLGIIREIHDNWADIQFPEELSRHLLSDLQWTGDALEKTPRTSRRWWKTARLLNRGRLI